MPDAHPLPLIENVLEKQAKHKIFIIADLSKGFHQIPLHSESGASTAMNSAGKRYQWGVMPMGIKNGPAIFQRVMDHVLQGSDCADVYIEDIIIGSSGDTEQELLATFNFTGHKVAKTRILSKWVTKLTHLCCVLRLF